MIFEYYGQTYEFEDHDCPHCGKPLEPWAAPPETGWSVVLVCNNNECPHYKGSDQAIQGKRGDEGLGCRYALNPDNGYKPFNLVSLCF